MLLDYILNNDYKETYCQIFSAYDMKISLKTFLIEMDSLAFKDLSVAFITWLNENSFMILNEVLKYIFS
jgi:hypothetical protein